MDKSKATLISLAAGIVCLTAAPALEAEAQVRGGGRTSVSRGGGGHQAAARASSGNRGQAANRGGQAARDVDRGDRTTNRNVERNNRSGNNINIDNDTNINIDGGDHDWDWDDRDHHPIAAGVAFGTAAAVTSAVVGSMIYSLPPACSPYMGSYYYCGGVYYAPQYQGDTVVYVVVDQPG